MAKRKKYSRESLDKQIDKIQAMCRRKPGEKPFAEEWAEYKAQERALEEAKSARMSSAQKSSSLISQPG